MLNLADAFDQVWTILRGMEGYIQGMDWEQQRAGQFHEDRKENIRDTHWENHRIREVIHEMQDVGRQQYRVNLVVERRGNQIDQLTQRIVTAEARAEAAEARATAVEATAAKALGLVNAIALGNIEEIVEESEPKEDPEEAPEEGPEGDVVPSTVSSAYSANP